MGDIWLSESSSSCYRADIYPRVSEASIVDALAGRGTITLVLISYMVLLSGVKYPHTCFFLHTTLIEAFIL